MSLVFLCSSCWQSRNLGSDSRLPFARIARKPHLFRRATAKAAEGVTAAALPSSPNTCLVSKRHRAGSKLAVKRCASPSQSMPRCGEAGRPSPTDKHSALPVTAFRLAGGRFWEIVRPRLLSPSSPRSKPRPSLRSNLAAPFHENRKMVLCRPCYPA